MGAVFRGFQGANDLWFPPSLLPTWQSVSRAAGGRTAPTLATAGGPMGSVTRSQGSATARRGSPGHTVTKVRAARLATARHQCRALQRYVDLSFSEYITNYLLE